MEILILIIVGLIKLHIHIHKMKKEYLIALGIIILIGVASATNFGTTFNPFTGKLDYYATGNQSGNNITVDFLFVDTIMGINDRVRIGDAGEDTHSLTADDDLFVSGKLEIDGDSYFDGIVSFFSTIGSALNLGGNNLQNVTDIDGYLEVINMEDNTTFSGDKDIHYGLLDTNNDFNAQADIKQGDINNLLLFNRTIDGSNIIFDSPLNMPFKFSSAMVILAANTTTMICNTTYEGGMYYDGVDYMIYFCNSTDWRAMA